MVKTRAFGWPHCGEDRVRETVEVGLAEHADLSLMLAATKIKIKLLVILDHTG